MVLVKLEWYELQIAASIGVRREIEALRKGSASAHGCSDDAIWKHHIEGAAGEMAFAKAVNRYYSGTINTYQDGGDVGVVQVRTRSRETYDLIVRTNDKDGDVFVLVTGSSPNFTVWGWIYGRDAKRAEWLQSHGGRESAYFVPKSALRQINATL